MATKIRGRQIETDDFIKSVRNADVDWTNDANTASQKAIAALVSGKFRVVTISYDSNNDVFSSDTSITDIISLAANGYYVVAVYCNQREVGTRGVCSLYELSFFEDFERLKRVHFVNVGYKGYTDSMRFNGKTQYNNGEWEDEVWDLDEVQPDYSHLSGVPTNLVNSYTVSNPAFTSNRTECVWKIDKRNFGNKPGETAILILKERGKDVTSMVTVYYDADYIQINIPSTTDIPADTYEAVIHA